MQDDNPRIKDIPRYLINRTAKAPHPDDLNSWAAAGVLEVASFQQRSSAHRPGTQVRLLYDDSGVFIRFDVKDCFVRSVHEDYQDPVSSDSCVEWFVQPAGQPGYFNFETNCGGTLLLAYADGSASVKRVNPVNASWVEQLSINTTMPRRVDPEIAGPVNWTLSYFVPFALFEHYAGPCGKIEGSVWRANFYKCGTGTSHPHWASWSPIREGNSFHQPAFFGELLFHKS